MALRSTRIIFKNNTPFPLIYSGDILAHGEWVKEPPRKIEPHTDGRWESESSTSSIGTGTEGVASYILENTEEHLIGESGVKGKCSDEWVEINWDNPYIPNGPLDGDLHYIGYEIQWHGSGTLEKPLVYDRSCQHELILVAEAGIPEAATGVVWYTLWWQFPGILISSALGEREEINLEFTYEIRTKGSIKESLLQVYDGRKGLLSLAKVAKQPSLKTVFKL